MALLHRRSAGSAAVLVAVGVLMLVSLSGLAFVLGTGTGVERVPAFAVDVREAVVLVALGLGVVALLAGVGFVAAGVAARRAARPSAVADDGAAGLDGFVRGEGLDRSARSIEEAGDLVAVEALDGVGPEMGARLDAAGVRTARDVLRSSLADLSRRAGLDAGAVRYLRRQAEFLAIRDVGPGEAALLVAVGVQDTEDLSTRDPGDLAHRLNDANRARHAVPGTFSVGEAQGWVEAARERRDA
ncbi:MAG TPA: DUF4332 domain-containing protein [Candidatus Thermoplasmatota archaeon]|nr:DUF4332 domain-containing protein [Candidatus Thermoplasmatota archaeon]